MLPPSQAGYDVTHYDIHLSIYPDQTSIAGYTDIYLTIVSDLDHIILDLEDEMQVSQIDFSVNGSEPEPARFEHSSGRLHVLSDKPLVAGDTVRLRVFYGGQPRVAPNPPWIGGFTWETTSDGRPWIATSVQMDGADVWLPVKDHPSDKADSVRISVTVPKDLVVASNGTLRGQYSAADSTTYMWFTGHPISNYNIALNIAPYQQITSSYTSVDGTEIPICFWVLPERLRDGRRVLPHFLEQLRWFEELIGPYPFRAEKYGVAHTPHLGMEHQTIIAYGFSFEMNEWGYDWLHHHELAHEWWSNLVTAPDWNDFWIHEGFGTYMQPLYVEHLHGRDAYHQEMASMRRYLNNRSPVAPRAPSSTREMYFIEGTTVSDNDIYYKGSWFLHTLRYLVGDETFFESLRRFAYPDTKALEATDGSQVRFATTDDYRELVERLSGRDLEWLFETYLRNAELPRLVVTRAEYRVEIRWETSSEFPFPMPVEIEVDGRRRRVNVDADGARLEIPSTASLAVDPDNWILRE